MPEVGRKIFVTFMMAAVSFGACGCQLAALFGSEGSNEGKVVAEYNLAEQKDKKILIFVQQPVHIRANANITSRLTQALMGQLMINAKMEAANFVPIEKLDNFRQMSNFSSLTPLQVAKSLDAKLLLYVNIDEYLFEQQADTNSYKGLLNSKAAVFDVETEQRVWPAGQVGKTIEVGFEAEQKGFEYSLRRLMQASAHCTVRHLYNCSKEKFKVIEDKSGAGWQEWK